MDKQDLYHDAVIDYLFDGKTFSVYIPSTSREEAEARLAALKATAHVEGWPCFRYSANPLTLPFGSLWTRIRIWLFERRN